MDDQMAEEFDPEESLSQEHVDADPRLKLLNDLPSPEEIYDLDTATLSQLLDCIASRQQDAEPDSAAFRRLKRLWDVIQLELDERLISADFEQNCMEVLNSWQQTVDIAQDLIKDDDYLPSKPKNALRAGSLQPSGMHATQPPSTSFTKAQMKRQHLPPLPHSDLLSTRREQHGSDADQMSLENQSNLQSTHNSSKESGNTMFPSTWEHAGLRTVKTGGSKKNDWKDFVKLTLGGTKLASTSVTVGIVAKKPPKPIVRRSGSTSDTSNDLHPTQSNRRATNLSSNSTQSSTGSIQPQVSIPRHKTEADSDKNSTGNPQIRFRRGLAGIASKSPAPKTAIATKEDQMDFRPTPKAKLNSSKSVSEPPKDPSKLIMRPASNPKGTGNPNPPTFLINKAGRGKSFGEQAPPQHVGRPGRTQAAPPQIPQTEAEWLSSVAGVCTALDTLVSCLLETSGFVLRYIPPTVLEHTSSVWEEASVRVPVSRGKNNKPGSSVGKKPDAKAVGVKDKTGGSVLRSAKSRQDEKRGLEMPAGGEKKRDGGKEAVGGGQGVDRDGDRKKGLRGGPKEENQVRVEAPHPEPKPPRGTSFGGGDKPKIGVKTEVQNSTRDQRKAKPEEKTGPKGAKSSVQSKSNQVEADEVGETAIKNTGSSREAHTEVVTSTKPSAPKPKPAAELITPIYDEESNKTSSSTPLGPSKATKEAGSKGFTRLPDPKKPVKKAQNQPEDETKVGSSRTMNLTAGSGFGLNPYNPSLGSTQALILPDSALGGVCHDYTHIIPTWAHLFSEYYTNPAEIDLSATMRDILQQYIKHVEVMKRMDSRLLEIAFSLSPLEYGMHDLIYKQDKNKLLSYISKTCIKWETYRNRQEVYLKTLDHREDVEEVENEDESDHEEPVEERAVVAKPATAQTHRQKQFFRVVKSKTEVYDIITKSFYRRQGWRELPHGLNLGATWNLLWAWGKVQVDLKKVLVFQKINHFSNIKHIGRKDNLKRSLERLMSMNTANQRFFNILPDSYNIPRDYSAFATASVTMREQEPDKEQVWIVKPAALSRGRGIYLIKSYLDLSYSESVVVQRYVTNPLLLDGYKFDLRIYVLVTSFQPLEVFLYKEGFARFASEKFTLDSDDIQKHHYIQKQTSHDSQTYFEDNGSKLTLTRLKAKLKHMNLSFDVIWEQIKLLILKSLVAAQPNIKQQPNSFELLGYDVLIDQNLHCWLLEVNCSPSLHKEHMIDEVIKQTLIDDIIDLMDPPDFDHHRLQEILARRIGEEQRHKSKISIHNNTKETLNRDLTYILKGKKLRRIGELPAKMGCFEMIAPTEMSEKVESFARGQPMKKPSGPVAAPQTVSAS